MPSEVTDTYQTCAPCKFLKCVLKVHNRIGSNIYDCRCMHPNNNDTRGRWLGDKSDPRRPQWCKLRELGKQAELEVTEDSED